MSFWSQNPIAHDYEYRIPGASSTGSGRTGRADMVNTATGEMFEIKPTTRITEGINEVATYVALANQNCPPPSNPLSSATGVPLIWRQGTNYPTEYLPNPRDPNPVNPSSYLKLH